MPALIRKRIKPVRKLLASNVATTARGAVRVYMKELGGTLVIRPGVFNPSLTKVSRFFARHVHIEHKNSVVLELGTGSGFLAIMLAQNGARVTATDVNPKALACANENAQNFGVHIRFLRSDLFSGLKGRKFDAIFFNPPLVPASPKEGRGRTVLKKLLEKSMYDPRLKLISRFMRDAGNHLKRDGRIRIVYSDLAQRMKIYDRPVIEILSKEEGFICTVLATKRTPNEVYTVYELTRAR